MYYKELHEVYKGLDGDELFNQIEKDFGPDAAFHLKTFGSLSLNEAYEFRNKALEDILGIKMHDLGHDGDLVGFVYNDPIDIGEYDIVLDFTTSQVKGV